MTQALRRSVPAPDRFWHEAFLYAGVDDFLDGTSQFISEGLTNDEPVLVVVDAEKIRRLRALLDADADRVTFLDMANVGRNPACIIPAWREFVDAHAGGGRSMRGIGEPIWAGRNDSELLECQLHEALLNTAFGEGPGWILMCPYDVTALGADVLAEAERSHPHLTGSDGRRASTHYDSRPVSLAAELPEPPSTSGRITFDDQGLVSLRAVVAEHAALAGIDELRAEELILAVHEAAANSLRYGGGRGELRLWLDPTALVCEVRDGGFINEPLIGRVRPAVEQEGGRGLWLINQLCDLVAVRSSDTGTVVRMHVNRPA